MAAPIPAPAAPGECVARLRARGPRVHCITNTVAEAFTANVLLAAGALPSVTSDPEEVPDFLARADALAVNLGTLEPRRRAGIAAALEVAEARALPWALDPVLIDRSGPRLALARELAARRPHVVRANADEIAALIGGPPAAGAVADYAGAARTVVALTGARDLVTDGSRAVTVANGDAMLGRVTAAGCAATALIAALLAVSDDALAAAVAGLAMVGVAAEEAAGKTEGPGGFAAALLDALYRLDAEELERKARLS